MQFSKRMDIFKTSIFTELAQIKEERIKSGKEVFDFSIGAPNIPPQQHIIDALAESVKDTGNYIYAINDRDFLLDAVSGWYKRRYQAELDPKTEIVSLLGSQEGLSHISLTIADPGDLVLVPDPCYPVFADGPRLAGAEIYYMPQRPENNFIIDLNEIPEAVAQKAKLMIVSYPNNPTTAVAPDSFYEELISFAKKYDIIVLHDNAYSELVFSGRGKSFLSFDGAKDVGVEFNSLSKTYGTAGARVGFCLGNKEVVAKLKALKSNMDYGMFLPIQHMAKAAVESDESIAEKTCEAYRIRRDVLCEGFSSIGWDIKKPEATMFVFAKIPEKENNSLNFCTRLIEQAGVITTPGSAFGPHGEGYVRFALVQDAEKIKEAVESVRKSGIIR